MSDYEKAGQKHSRRVLNRSFEDVAKFRCLGTSLEVKTARRKMLRAE
jgi:hypothetical protein